MSNQVRPFIFRNVRRALSVMVDMEVKNAHERYSIPDEMRTEEFLCRQLNTDEFYILDGGIENTNWVPFDINYILQKETTPGNEDFSKNYQILLQPPDVNEARVGDTWTHPVKLKEYRLIDQDSHLWWVETTSSRLIPAKLFDHTFDKSFN